MKTITSTIILILSCVFAFSQNKDFDLSKYKLPDIKRHQLDLSFSADGNNIWNKSSYDSSGNPVDDEIKKSQSNIDAEMSMKYGYFYNTRKMIMSVNSSISPKYLYQKSNQNKVISETESPEFNFQTTSSFSYYPKSNGNLFIQINPQVYYNYYAHDQKMNEEIEYESKNNSVNAYLGFGVGKGRMEPISDLWQSYYILKKLDIQKSLAKELTEDDIFEFARLSSKLKNKRFFDSRERKIMELKSLDSLMINRNLIDSSDISYFTTLNDYWSFANISDRNSGNVLKLEVIPMYYHNQQKSKTQNVESNEFYLSPELSFQSVKPLNLFWDRNIWVQASNRIRLDQSDADNKSVFILSSAFGYSYYPNFRTSIKTSVAYLGVKHFMDESIDISSWQNHFRFDCSVYYYLSAQLRLIGNMNLYCLGTSSNNNILASYNLGVNYAIF